MKERLTKFGAFVAVAGLALTGLAEFRQAEATLSLSGVWQLREQGSSMPSVPMKIPGGVHTALREAGLAPDYYWGTNEAQVVWIGRRQWEATRQIDVSPKLANKESVVLQLEGADTYVDAYVNGKLAGRCDDYFQRWTFEVKPLLKVGTNDIRLVFRSSHAISDALGDLMPLPLPCSYPQFVAHSNLIRKPHCNGGWDWGISLMTAGVSESIELIGTDFVRIDYVQTRQVHAKGSCDLDVSAEVVCAKSGSRRFEVSVGETVVSRDVYLTAGRHTVHSILSVPRPRLWWPNGQGEQTLYPLTVSLGGARLSRKIGLRTVELVNDRDPDGKGLSMTFRVNGRDVFMKGANWIPCDATLSGQTDARRRDLLESCRAANMNMIRVWGGGRFESDGFYEICDELGLLVWQDFTMACSKFPGFDTWFVDSVRQEALHQVKRLSDHPCIALWCGDNEILWGLDYFSDYRQYNYYDKAYFRLNDTIREVFENHDPERAFWISSPCAGPGDMANCGDVDYKGDMHYWGVWHESKGFKAYYGKRPRFCGEFGFQSFPSEELAERYAPTPIDIHEPNFAYHQKNPGGNERIIETMKQHFKVPTRTSDILYLSQVQQALAIKTAIEFWRSIRPRCMGTLVWQLNDNWPVTSWSSIEYGGKWKMLHYQERRSFAPQLITAHDADAGDDTTRADVWTVNDDPADRPATAVWECFDFEGKRLSRFETNLVLKAAAAQKIGEFRDDPHGFWRLKLMQGGKTLSENVHFFRPLKDSPLAKAEVKAEVDGEDRERTLVLTADKPAFYVWVNVKNLPGEFDDNFLTLLPGEKRTIHWRSKGMDSIGENDFRSRLSVRNLRETY